MLQAIYWFVQKRATDHSTPTAGMLEHFLSYYFRCCDDIQHISAIYSDSTSNKKSNGRSQHESTVNDSQRIARNVIFPHLEFPRRNTNN